MLDVRRLMILEAVARYGSFTAAAAALSYTQPAISQQIAALERETRRPALDDPFYAVLPAGHHLAPQRVVRIADLAEEHWIATSSPGHPDADSLTNLCATAGFVPIIAFAIDDHLAVQGFVAAGAGVALVPRLGLNAIRTDLAVLPIDPPAARPVDVITIKSARPAPAVSALLDALRDASV
jgi:DNA-binding transcriptional LysR family regulator